jgi:hypothetical protein
MMIRRAGELMTRLGFDFVATVNHWGHSPFRRHARKRCGECPHH